MRIAPRKFIVMPLTPLLFRSPSVIPALSRNPHNKKDLKYNIYPYYFLDSGSRPGMTKKGGRNNKVGGRDDKQKLFSGENDAIDEFRDKSRCFFCFFQ